MISAETLEAPRLLYILGVRERTDYLLGLLAMLPRYNSQERRRVPKGAIHWLVWPCQYNWSRQADTHDAMLRKWL